MKMCENTSGLRIELYATTKINLSETLVEVNILCQFFAYPAYIVAISRDVNDTLTMNYTNFLA